MTELQTTMRGEVIAIGDELTSGQRLDTNSQWLSERLTELGVEVMFHSTVGDDLEANANVFRAAAARADVIVCTGGLGPTADDLTREALAAAAGVDLVEDAAALAHIRALFASRAREMPERNARQALLPRGASVIPNPHGTAPGVDIRFPRAGRGPARLFALPGVPAEMHEMWAATVAPAIAGESVAPRVIRHRRIKCFGTGESQLESMLPDLFRRGREPRVGITVSEATITLRITAAGADEATCCAAIGPTEELARQSLGELVFGEEEEELQHVILRMLGEHGQTLATHEAATRGLVAMWLADADPGGAALRLAEVSYDLCGASAPEAAEQARQRFGANFGLAVGPAPVENAAGEAQSAITIALAHPGGLEIQDFPTAGHPAIVKPRAAKQALNLLRLHLLKHPS